MDAGRAPVGVGRKQQAVERRRDEKLVRALAWHARQESHGGTHRDPELPQPGVGIVRGLLERGDGRCVSGDDRGARSHACSHVGGGTVSKGLRALVELRPNLLLCPFLGGLSILSRARLAAAPEASVVLYAATTFGPWLPTSSGPATGHGTTGA
ncbi:hypothetical protein GQ600_10089 [Phytophthora cactorum]|nr:hypothetical protein GQ600_10089 [Phytophthora cactorum]